MVAITTEASEVYRDYEVAGLPASGENDPAKSEIRALFATVEGAITSVVEGALVGDAVAYSTRAGLYADLAHVAGTIGFVYADATAAYNGFYVKVGGSGSGSWSLLPITVPANFLAQLSAVESGLAAETVDRAAADDAEATARADADALKADKATAITVTGLLARTSGDGTLGAAQTIGVPKASGAEAVTGSNDTKAITPLALKAARDADSAIYLSAKNEAVAAKDEAVAAAVAADTDAATASAKAADATAEAVTATNARAEAQTARDEAIAAAEAGAVTGGFYDTYAAANAALASIPANAVIEIFADETKGGLRTQYRKESGVLVWKITFPDAVARQALGEAEPAYGAVAADINAKIAANAFVRVDSAVSPAAEADGDLRSRADGWPIGEGSVAKVYGKHVVPDLAPSDAVSTQGDLRAAQLPRLNAATAPVVVLAGDSISTFFANSNEITQCMLTTELEAAIRNQAGSKAISFHNRSIGGQGYAGLDGTPVLATYPVWYTDTGATWLSYLQALNPDVVVVALGMNVAGDVLTRMASIRTKIKAWTKAPDIVWSTNLVPSPSTASPSWNTIADQEARIAQASATRHFALFHGDGLLDFNRQQMVTERAYDPRTNIIRRDGTAPVVNAGGNATAGANFTNFAWTLTLDQAAWGTTGYASQVYVKIGQGTNDNAIISRMGDGSLEISVYYGDTSDGLTLQETKSAWSPNVVGGNYRLIFEVFDNILLVRDGNDPTGQFGSSMAPWWVLKTKRRAARFIPTVQTAGALRPLLSTRFDKGEVYSARPTAKTTQLWGDGLSGTDDTGGSGYNHPGSAMAPAVYRPVLGRASWFGLADDVRSFTPVIAMADASGPPTITGISGQVEKIGRRVFGEVLFQITALNGATGYIMVDGLPWAVSGLAGTGAGRINFKTMQVAVANNAGAARVSALMASNVALETGFYALSFSYLTT